MVSLNAGLWSRAVINPKESLTVFQLECTTTPYIQVRDLEGTSSAFKWYQDLRTSKCTLVTSQEILTAALLWVKRWGKIS